MSEVEEIKSEGEEPKTNVSAPAEPAKRAGCLGWLKSEFALGTLVTILSILTAVVAYTAELTNAAASGNELEAVRLLTESNTEYIQSSQFIILDYTMYDNYYVNLGVDDFAADYYANLFSQSLVDAIDRNPDTFQPFDETYTNEQYGTADDLYAQAIELFEKGGGQGDVANQYQLVMMIYAVGLSFAAWSSIADEKSRSRTFFAIFSVLTLLLGSFTFMIAIFSHLALVWA